MSRRVLSLVVGAALAAACSRGAPSMSAPSGGSSQFCGATLQLGRSYFGELGGQTTLTVAAVAGCGWQVTHPDWMTVAPASGSGNTVAAVSVAAYADTRVGYLATSRSVVALQQAPELKLLNPRCSSGRPGTLILCTVLVEWAKNPPSTRTRPTADMRMFGQSERRELVLCQGCPEYEMDLRIPLGFPPGSVEIRFRLEDGEGRVATASTTLTVLPA